MFKFTTLALFTRRCHGNLIGFGINYTALDQSELSDFVECTIKVYRRTNGVLSQTESKTGEAMYKTSRFLLPGRVFSDNTQRTSKRGKNISHATRLRFVVYFLVPTTFLRFFYVIRALLEYALTIK